MGAGAGAGARAETREGWSEHSRVRACELAGHTLACVTLPVICTVLYLIDTFTQRV